MSPKNIVRTVVVLGVLAWPAVETIRLWATTQKLHEAQALERSVTAKLASVRAQHAQIAKADSAQGTVAKP